MAFEVEATYENGVLKLDKPLPLAEQERVTILVKPSPHSRVWQNVGTALQWTGDPAVLRMIAEDPEFGVAESR